MSMADGKITASRLARDAYLYVRQSTLRQVAEHGESTQRQYALRNCAIALGWPTERIHVIDCDLGKSGADAAGRHGFQKLVSEVALGKVGIILGLEVSTIVPQYHFHTFSRINSENSVHYGKTESFCLFTTGGSSG